MMNEEREKKIRIANMLIGEISDLIRPILMYQIEKDVTKEALENYIKILEQQPCEDCISRDAVMSALFDLWEPTEYNDEDEFLEWLENSIKRLPSVTPSRPRGKWIYKNDNKLIASDMGYWQCSNCEEGKLLYESAYCPNCGADMKGMNEQMSFPETFEGFAKEYGFKDDKEVYTNGIELIPIFRVKQWLEQDNKLRAIETDTAYECGKHANKWIPIKTRPMTEEEKEEIGHEYAYMYDCSLPDDGQEVLITDCYGNVEIDTFCRDEEGVYFEENCDDGEVIAWMPKPEPYKGGGEEE